MGRLFHFYARTCRRSGCWFVRITTDRHGSTILGVLICLVPGCSTRFAALHGDRSQRQSRTQNSTGLGSAIRILLAVLARPYNCNGQHFMAGRTAIPMVVANENGTTRSQPRLTASCLQGASISDDTRALNSDVWLGLMRYP